MSTSSTAAKPGFDTQGERDDEARVDAAMRSFVREFGVTAALHMESCVRCGICAEACHFHIATRDPKYTPVHKLELFRRAYFREASPFAPLVRALGLLDEAATLICGDTTPHSKPHPAPLLEAARRLGVPAEECASVGDDLRDVQAGRAAGMVTLAAAWGYLGQGEPVHDWGADRVLSSPGALLHWLELA